MIDVISILSAPIRQFVKTSTHIRKEALEIAEKQAIKSRVDYPRVKKGNLTIIRARRSVMASMSFRLNEDDEKFIKEYLSKKNLDLSAFVLQAIMEKIEGDLALDEVRLADALERAHTEKDYNHTEVWNMLEA